MLSKSLGNFGVVEQAKKRALQGVAFTQLLASFDKKQFETATLDDAALQAEILGLFDDQLKAMQDKLALGPLGLDDCKFLGHTLRGSAAAVGALEIEALAAVCEKSFEDQSEFSAGFTAAVDRFRQATQRYRQV
jgi:Hpt domain